MRVTLDLTDLVQRGEITKEEAERLARLAVRGTGTLGSNVLLSLGTVIIALGGGLLFPSVEAVMAIGIVLFGLGLTIVVAKAAKWDLFGRLCMTLGALGIAGATYFTFEGALHAGLALAVVLGFAAVVARSGLLASLAVIQLAISLATGSPFWEATDNRGFDRPAVTIAGLSAATLALYLVSLRVPSAYERVAIIAARTAILLINGAFLVASLVGDASLGWPPVAFAILWAVLLLGTGVWAMFAGRRWVVSAAAVFGVIHFLVQWFTHLEPGPVTILAGGVLLIGLALFLRWISQRMSKAAPAG